MKENFAKKIKIFIVAVLVLLVAGMTVFGIFGFNQPVDYADKYEVHIIVDQNTKNEKAVVVEYAEKAFDELGVSPSSYATQIVNDGEVVIYKFNEDLTASADKILQIVQKGLDEKGEVSGVKAEVKVYETLALTDNQTGWVILALGVAVIVAFIAIAIFNSVAQALAVAFSTILSAVLFIALSALVRIPAGSFIAFSLAVSAIFTAVISIFTVARYKEMRKDPEYEREDASVLAWKVFGKDVKKTIVFAIFTLISVITLIAVFVPYLMFIAGQLAIALVVGSVSAWIGTPFFYGLIGKKK